MERAGERVYSLGTIIFLVSLAFFFRSTAYGQDQPHGHEIPPLRPPHAELSPTFWDQHGLQILIAATFVIFAIALLILRLRRPKFTAPESPAVIARRDLEKGLARPEDGALVADVTRVLKRYVMSAFHFPPEELTTAEFRKTLQTNLEIQPELATATADFLQRCDEWKFSPAPPAPKLQAAQTALDLVNKFETTRERPSPQSQIANQKSAIQ